MDLSDTHTLTPTLSSTSLSGGGAASGALLTALSSALSVTSLDPATGDGSGQYQWDFALDNSLVQSLGEGDFVTAVYEIEIADNHGASDTQQVTITVTGTNDVPVIGGVATGAVTEDADPLTLDVAGALTITEWMPGDQVYAQASTPGNHGYGTFTLDAAGNWTYSADNTQAAIQGLAVGESVTDSFTATSSDGTASQLVTVTITGTNDQIVITSGSQSGAAIEIADLAPGENTDSHSANGTVTFADVDLADTHTASFVPQDTGYRGSFVLASVDQNADAVGWAFDIDDADLDDLAAGQVLTQHYDVTVDDGHGSTATQTVTITLTGSNDAPVLSTETSALLRASVSGSGQEANGYTGGSVISPDGELVAFQSFATNLTAADADSDLDVLAKNMATGAVARVSTNQAGDHVNNDVDVGTPWAISADNNLVLFTSDQTLSPDDDSQSGVGPAGLDQSDVYIKNLSTGAVTLVNTDQSGVHQIQLNAQYADMSDDGSVVVFTTSDFSFWSGDGHVMVKNLMTGELTEVDRAADGTLANQSAFTESLGISADGTKVMFASPATNLVAGILAASTSRST